MGESMEQRPTDRPWDQPDRTAGATGGAGPAWLAVAVGALALLGSFLPLVTTFGVDLAWAVGWGRAAVLASSAGLVGGGLLALRHPVGLALAAGSAVTFVGFAAPAFNLARFLLSAPASETNQGTGLVLWSLAAAGCVAIVVVALVVVGPERADAGATTGWAAFVGAAGIGVLWLGLFVDGNPFVGDEASNGAAAVLLAGLPVAALVLALVRSRSAAAFACGVTAPWALSWLVFAVGDRFGGLPIPFPDQPALAALALLAVACLGGFWWAAPADGAATGAGAGVGAGALGAGQVVAIVVCGVVGLAALGGAASASDSSSPGFGVAVPTTGEGWFNYVPGGTPEEEDSIFDDDYESGYEAPEAGSSGGSGSGSAGGSGSGGVELEECVETVCSEYPEQADLVTDLVEQSDSGGIDFGDQWIAQVQANAIDSSEEQVRRSFDALAADLPDLRVALSDDYASLTPGFIVFFVADGFADSDEALAFCRASGRPTGDLCFARYLSDDPADRDTIITPG